MNRRNVVLLIPLVMTIILVAATLFIPDGHIRKLLFYAVLITALITVVAYFFVTSGDIERLRRDYEANIARIDRRHEVDRALIGSSIGHQDAELREIRKRIFADLTVQSAELDEAKFASVISKWLSQSDHG